MMSPIASAATVECLVYNGAVNVNRAVSKARAASTAGRQGGQLDGMSFFEHLPSNALHNVLRHMSDKPRRTNWAAFISPRVLIPLLTDSSPLHASVKQKISSLVIFRTKQPLTPGGISVELALNFRPDHVLLSEILQRIGSHLSEVALPAAEGFVGRFSDCFLSIHRHCTALKHLDLRGVKFAEGALEKLIEANSQGMQTLILPAHVPTEYAKRIRHHCSGVKKLAINLCLSEHNVVKKSEAADSSVGGEEDQSGSKGVEDNNNETGDQNDNEDVEDGNKVDGHERNNQGVAENSNQDADRQDAEESPQTINEGAEDNNIDNYTIGPPPLVNTDEEPLHARILELSLFLISVGPTLEELDLSFYLGHRHRIGSLLHVPTVKACLQMVQKYCRNLRKIEFAPLPHDVSPPEDVYRTVADLFASYGAQLEHASMHDLPPPLCAEVVKSCPNLRTSCTGFDSLVAERMAALGPSLTSIQFEWKRPPRNVDAQEFVSAGQLCTNVRRVHATDVALWATTIFHALPNLSSVHIYILFGLSPSFITKILRSIAKNSATLTDFTYKGDLPESGAFREIAERNPLLENVTIKVRTPEGIYWPEDAWGPYEERLSEIVMAFLGCTHLRELIIIDHGYPNFHPDVLPDAPQRTAVTEACGRFRAKSVFIHVLGIDYLK